MPAPACIIEVCVDSVAGARAADSAGAHRVELCSDLVEGGITPSYGLIKQARQVLDRTKLMVLIRPRGGDFLYSEDEVAVMLADIVACKQLGANGVVIGGLLPDGALDITLTVQLLQAARRHELDVTFHRAVDACSNISQAVEQLIGMGIPRILTSGGHASAQQGADVIAGLVKQAAGRISVMAGGGVNAGNAAALLAATGVMELHSTCKRRHHSAMQYKRPNLIVSSALPLDDYVWNCTDESEVERLLQAACASHSQDRHTS